MNRFWILTLLAIGFSAQAQIIEDKSKVLDKRGGEERFELNGGEDVYSFAPISDWYKIRKEIWLKPEDVVDDKYIISGAKFFNEEDEEIGQALVEFKVKEGREEESFRGKKRFHAIIEGWVFKTKLRDGSIPEKRVEEILAVKNRNIQQKHLNELYAIYSFEEREFDDLIAKVYREENKNLGEKDFRIILIFRSETMIYAVMTNDHVIEAPKIKDTWEDEPFRTIFFQKPPARQKQKIEDILYTFLAL